jgi:lysophospholipase L1-like esterase
MIVARRLRLQGREHTMLFKTQKGGTQSVASGSKTPGRVGSAVRLALYCIGIFFALDFAYSSLTDGSRRRPGVPSDIYHHDLAPNFDGHNQWGKAYYRMFTNSLGFKDAGVREVPPAPATRRILLIGDSFTEGVGLPFDATFAGMLHRAGQTSGEKTEVLNAAVGSYSSVIYYKKIRHLLEKGVRFHEVVVLPDISDVWDEATGYFCIDDNPQYKARCRLTDSRRLAQLLAYLRRSFVVTHQTSQLINTKLRSLRERRKADANAISPATLVRGAWADRNSNPGSRYAPLGVEGGIERSRRNMQALADLLKKAGISLTVAVYPWPSQVAAGDRENRQVTLWREFCAANCKRFIDLFPAFMAEKEAHPDWQQRLFIAEDVHFSPDGHKLVFRELAQHLLR